MTPVRVTIMTSFMYSGPVYSLFLFWIHVVLAMHVMISDMYFRLTVI